MKNLRIRNKILVLLAGLLIANAGLFFKLISSMSMVNDQSTIIADNWLPSVQQLGEVGLQVSALRRYEMKLVIAALNDDQEMVKTTKTEIQARMKMVEDALGLYAPMVTGSEEKLLYETIMITKDDYEHESQKLVEMVGTRKPGEVKDQLFVVMKPKFDAFQKAVEADVAYNDKGSKAASHKGDLIYASERRDAIIGIAVSTALCAGIIVLLTRGIASPIVGLKSYMGVLQSGDYGQDVPFADRRDEIGEMSAAIEKFRESLIANREMERQQTEETERKLVRQRRVEQLVREFDEKVSAAVSSVAAAATELSQTAQEISVAARTSTEQASGVSNASKQTSSTVQAVAAAAEEMTAAVREISDQVARSIQIVGEATSETKLVSATSAEMLQAAKSIGSVAELIEGIASQINLLALNATIESARAGEAGKGFAVVASEVKTLASQTTKATEEIRQKLDAVRTMAERVSGGVDKLDGSVDKVSHVSNNIASAVEEQTAVTQEITRNMNVAAQGVEQIDGSIGGIQQSAQSAAAATDQILGAATMLSRQAEDLNAQVRTFLNEMKAA